MDGPKLKYWIAVPPMDGPRLKYLSTESVVWPSASPLSMLLLQFPDWKRATNEQTHFIVPNDVSQFPNWMTLNLNTGSQFLYWMTLNLHTL